MVTPLTLAITPMSVLQNPDFGEAYGKLFEEGEVDDRLLVILFLMVERLRGSCSVWAPYSTMPCKEMYFCILCCKDGIHSFLTCYSGILMCYQPRLVHHFGLQRKRSKSLRGLIFLMLQRFRYPLSLS